jgi:uncharacterized protein (TIGR00725 family)
MTRRPIVAVVGDSWVEAGSAQEDFAVELGRGLVDAGFRLQTGGRGGVMEASSRGAHASARWVDGTVIGLLPGFDPNHASSFVDVAIPTGLGHGRNLIVAQADAVVAVGGGAGTLSEMAFAWMFSRLLLAWRGGGWSGRLADTRIDDRVRLPEVPDDRVYGVDRAMEAVALIVKLLPVYATSARRSV